MDGNEIAKDDLDDEEIPQPQTNKETTLSFLVVGSSCYFTWSKTYPKETNGTNKLQIHHDRSARR